MRSSGGRLPANLLATMSKLDEAVDIRRQHRASDDDDLAKLIDAAVFRVPQNLCPVLKKDLEFAGVTYKTRAGYLDVHSLRHTTGTRLTTDPSIPTRTAQQFMRHSDPRLTTQTYTDKRFLDLRAALDAVPRVSVFGDDADAEPNTLRATGADDGKEYVSDPY